MPNAICRWPYIITTSGCCMLRARRAKWSSTSRLFRSVCFFSYIRLHHRSSEDEIELIRLVFAVKLAERASAFAYVRIDVPGGAFFERLVHRDRINLFHVLFLSGRSVRPSTFTVYSIHYRCANFKCRDRVSRKRRCFSYDNRECRKLFRDKDV